MQSVLQFLHTVMQQLQPAIQWIRDTVLSLLASSDRWIVYTAAAWIALLLIAIPLFRVSGRRRRRSEPFEEVRSYSVLGIGPTTQPNHSDMDDVIRPVRTYPRWADTAPLVQRPVPKSAPPADRPVSKSTPPADRPVAEPPSNVTPIRPSMAVKCTHCGAALSANQDFCPACGYAQPVHSVTA